MLLLLLVDGRRDEGTRLGRLGVVNAALGAAISTLGLSLQNWARQRARRENRGLEPFSTGRAYYETRAAVYLGVLCVVCGAVSGVIGDAMLPQSTQAPLAAFATALRTAFNGCFTQQREDDPKEMRSDEALLAASRFSARNDDDDFDDYDESSAVASRVEEKGAACDVRRRPRAVALALMVVGPAIALVGARLDDAGGLSGPALARLYASPSTASIAAFSLAAAVLARRRSGLGLAALGSALASAWAHVAVKGLVEVSLFYAGDAFFAEPACWVVLLAVPVLVSLKLRAVSASLTAYHAGLFMPVYQSLAIAANAACGVFVYDDFGYLELSNPAVSPANIIAYGVGLACTVAGVVLTAADHVDDDLRAPVGLDEENPFRPSPKQRRRRPPDFAEDQKRDDNDDTSLEFGAASRHRGTLSVPRPPPGLVGGAPPCKSWDSAAAEAASSSTTFTAGLSPHDAPALRLSC
ncbi:hypothetical protein CTAYLR_002787 [Chrysophaeum taylorii]|uniref:Uncharacterized protein n=1 Tax=Chrysophaeum taylorii TaxID=2483200 RepID=A0AAD7UBS7_9STRA|nr:hypothetical protein CTAYLR_002787 [Chrysophaeum taylorii]